MYSNFTEETCTGTGATLALAGITTGKIPFSESYADGDLVAYVLEDSGGVIKIAGVGVYVSATDDITRNDTWNWNGTVIDDNPSTNITLSGGTHTVRCDLIDHVINPNYKPESNVEYLSGDVQTGQNVTIALSGDTAYVMPFRILHSGFYDNTRIRVVSAGTATKARIALYSLDANTDIDAEIFQTGDISVTGSGEKISSVTSTFLTRGYYFIVILTDGTVTIDAQGIGVNIHIQSLWGILGDFSTRIPGYATQSVTTSWSTIVTLTTIGTKNTGIAPALALVAT